ncbi:MAG: hypothetical protein HYZ39_04885 [Mycolicibacterium cosmeticum]|nr:hypothetical protein [Mycolicibacterium cosmeticum]
MSIRIAPGVNLRASGSSVRASTRAERTRSASARYRPPKKSQQPSAAEGLLAGLELVAGIAAMIGTFAGERDAKRLASDSLRAAKILTTLHLEEFPRSAKPIRPRLEEAPRRWNNLWFIDDDEQLTAKASYLDRMASYRRDMEQWNLLKAHDRDVVIATVDQAFADNASQSVCVDAGRGGVGNYLTLVVQYPGLEIAEGIVQSGSTTRPRSEKEKIELYRRAVASTVIATAKEAFACAPAAQLACVVVLRYDLRGRFTKVTSQLDAIYAATLSRRVLSMDWAKNNLVDVMLSASDLRVNQDRKGRLKPLGKNAGDDLAQVVASISNAYVGTAPMRRRFLRTESVEFMRTQAPEAFVSFCPCPGCDQLDTHSFRAPRTDEPKWAEVVRACRWCNMEWAQA